MKVTIKVNYSYLIKLVHQLNIESYHYLAAYREAYIPWVIFPVSKLFSPPRQLQWKVFNIELFFFKVFLKVWVLGQKVSQKKLYTSCSHSTILKCLECTSHTISCRHWSGPGLFDLAFNFNWSKLYYLIVPNQQSTVHQGATAAGGWQQTFKS